MLAIECILKMLYQNHFHNTECYVFISDTQLAKTEKESLKVSSERQTKSFNDERRKAQLLAHQNREKQALLQEQISALKDGIQQLAQVGHMTL